MPDTAKRLTGPLQLGTSAGTVYNVPASTTTIVRNIHVVNVDTVPRTFSLSIGSEGPANRIYSSFSLNPGQTLTWSGFLVLFANEVLQALASAASAVNITISGVETT